MIGTEKYYTQKLRAEANIDRHNEAQHKRAPGHMTMRAVEKLEHKRDQDNDFRFTVAIGLAVVSIFVTGPQWLDWLATFAGFAAGTYWVGMSLYTWKQTKARVLTVLENHEYLKYEAATERY